MVYHEDLRMNVMINSIPLEEDLNKWLDLPPTTNIVTIFDTFEHDEYKFSILELSNMPEMWNMYKYIQSLNLQLGINIPITYMETVYDCIIQLVIGMDYAH